MKTCSRNHDTRQGERGVTILFVAIAMVAIIGMAALSIDVIVLYLAREKRSARQMLVPWQHPECSRLVA